MSGSEAGPVGNAPGGVPEEHGDLLVVHIIGMPIDVQHRAQEHADELIRELTLVGEQLRQRGNSGELPARLVELVEALTATYSSFTVEQEQQLAAAVARGQPSLDLVYRLPPAVTDAVRALSDILDEADEYCRAGRHLLTLATPPDLLAYRRWFLEEFVRQAAGEAPQSWPQFQQLRSGPRTP